MCARRGFTWALALATALVWLPGASGADKGVTIEVDKKHIDFKVDGNLVASYRIDPEQSKPYFYPLNALPGQGVTENGPSDHKHHRSAWFCHGDVIPEGLKVKKHFKHVDGV